MVPHHRCGCLLRVEGEHQLAGDGGDASHGKGSHSTCASFEKGHGIVRIGVVGGGVAGLTAAYELAKRGHEVVLFEREPYLGGQASTFEIEGTRLERYYHHIFTGDEDMMALMGEL
ncbi:MAG: FAD-dependent oxidoreductase, partial [Anaerolineae bacterium]|nr:FAD-dependent oxidoreductase [Anaerolineae bacterium]NIN95986.1 FAD-dependent oxidoreductase [Anaerolineae bacterium]NIQ79018.1 FAD-dependent oxidoreductase [Anaerolineae bacterium]